MNTVEHETVNALLVKVKDLAAAFDEPEIEVVPEIAKMEALLRTHTNDSDDFSGLLDFWFVMYPPYDSPEVNTALPDWYAVGNEDQGIVAYFAKESDAYGFRLTKINVALNEPGAVHHE